MPRMDQKPPTVLHRPMFPSCQENYGLFLKSLRKNKSVPVGERAGNKIWVLAVRLIVEMCHLLGCPHLGRYRTCCHKGRAGAHLTLLFARMPGSGLNLESDKDKTKHIDKG